MPGKFSHSSNMHEKFKALMIRASENGHMKIIQQGKDSDLVLCLDTWD